MIQFLTIVQAQEGDWTFTWPATTAPYRIILNGKEIATVQVESYVFEGLGYTDHAPPIEIVGAWALAASEVDRPFLRIQWYPDISASGYLVQQYQSGVWNDIFSINEIGSGVYTIDSQLLSDGSSYSFQVFSHNETEDVSTPRQYVISVITPPNFVDTSYVVEYDNATQAIVLRLST